MLRGNHLICLGEDQTSDPQNPYMLCKHGHPPLAPTFSRCWQEQIALARLEKSSQFLWALNTFACMCKWTATKEDIWSQTLVSTHMNTREHINTPYTPSHTYTKIILTYSSKTFPAQTLPQCLVNKIAWQEEAYWFTNWSEIKKAHRAHFFHFLISKSGIKNIIEWKS